MRDTDYATELASAACMFQGGNELRIERLRFKQQPIIGEHGYRFSWWKDGRMMLKANGWHRRANPDAIRQGHRGRRVLSAIHRSSAFTRYCAFGLSVRSRGRRRWTAGPNPPKRTGASPITH